MIERKQGTHYNRMDQAINAVYVNIDIQKTVQKKKTQNDYQKGLSRCLKHM